MKSKLIINHGMSGVRNGFSKPAGFRLDGLFRLHDTQVFNTVQRHHECSASETVAVCALVSLQIQNHQRTTHHDIHV